MSETAVVVVIVIDTVATISLMFAFVQILNFACSPRDRALIRRRFRRINVRRGKTIPRGLPSCWV
jgi:TnpA family transposase